MTLRTLLLAGAALGCATPAFADDAAVMQRLDQMQHMIEAQQAQIAAQNAQIDDLKHALVKKGTRAAAMPRSTPAPQTVVAAAPPPAPMQDQLNQQQAQIDKLTLALNDTQTSYRLDKQEQPIWSFANGHPLLSSPDGRFTMAFKFIGQFDAADYMQNSGASILPNGPDLSSGTNFRRAQLGFQGTLFGDWSYRFNYDFGGTTTEGQGRIQSLYVQYDGLKPFAFRFGASPPPGGLEDNTGATETIFLERTAPSDILRSTVGGTGRNSASILYFGDKLYAALSWSGGKVTDGPVFDEQDAVLGRVAETIYADSDSRFVVGASGAYVLKAPDLAPGAGSPHGITLSSTPELTVDSTGSKLISTGALNTDHVAIWGVEAGLQWKSFYGQGGYFGYIVPRTAPASNLNFDGWYAEATWVLTGENRGYSTTSGAFTAPKPRVAFSMEGGGWGAWELAARYSDVDLNDNAGVLGAPVPVGGLRGGEQRVITGGINWYPNSVLRFTLDWQNVDVDRIGTIAVPPLSNTQVGQRFNVVSFRSQISL